MPGTREGDIVELVHILDGTVSELKEYVEENDPDEEQLEKLLQAEKNNKDRKTAKEFLEEEIARADAEETIQGARHEIEEVEEALRKVENSEELETEVKNPDLEQEEVLEAVGGTVPEFKRFLVRKKPGVEALGQLLEAEKSVKDREQVKEAIRKRKEKLQLGYDVEKAEEYVESVERDLEQKESDLPSDLSQESSSSRDRLDDFSSRLQDSRDDELAEAMKQIEEGGETAEDEEETEDEPETREPEKEDEEADIEEEMEEIEEESEEEEEEPEGGEDGAEEEEKSDLEKKREIAEELDVEMDDEELEQISLEEMERMKSDKEEREKLIEELEGEFLEEDLRRASTADLRKLKASMEGDSGDAEEAEKEEKDDEEIKEEAEEDLEMLMGAVGKDDVKKGDSLRDSLEKVTEFKNNVSKILHRRSGDEEEGDEERIQDDKVLQLLENYRELDPHEAAIKVAHIMKGYLEYREGIDRELTYQELADEIDDRGDGDLQELLEFFDTMHKTQYTGNIDEANVSNIIDASRSVVKNVY